MTQVPRKTKNLPELLSLTQVSNLLEVDAETLRRWEKEGSLQSVKNPDTGRRAYHRQEVLRLQNSGLYSRRLSKLNSRQLLRQMARLMHNISSSLNEQEMAQTVVNEAVQVIGSDRSAIYLLSPDQAYLLPFVAVDVEDSSTVETLFYPNVIPATAQPLFDRIITDKQTTYVSNTFNSSLTTPEFFEKFGTQSLLIAPLLTPDERLLGVLGFFWSKQVRLFTSEELIFAEALADQTAVGLENARLHQQQHNRARELETIIESINDGLALYDTNFELIRRNSALERIINQTQQLPPDGPPERPDQIKLHKLDGSLYRTEESPGYRAIVLGEPVPYYEMVIDGESGPNTLVAGSAVPLFDSQGGLQGGVVLVRNITEQSMAQERIRQLSQQAQSNAAELETILESLSDGVIVHNTRMDLVRINRTARRILQRVDLTNPWFAQRLRNYNMRYLDGRPVAPEDTPGYRASVLGQVVSNMDLLVDGESGLKTVVNCNSTPMFDENGVLRGGVVVIRNVTEIYEAGERMSELSELAQANAAKLQAVLNSAADGIVVYDNDSRIIMVNQRVTEMYGIPRAEIEGLTSARFAEKIRPQYDPATDLSAAVRRVEQLQSNYVEELELLTPHRRTIQRLVTPVIDEAGRVQGKVAIYRDITQERILARAKDEFIALATHEMRTPLTALKGFSQILHKRLQAYRETLAATGAVTGDLDNLLAMSERITLQSSRLNDLMSNLLDVSRLAIGKMQIQPRPFDLVKVLRETLEQVQVATAEHTLQFSNLAAKSYMVMGDAPRVEQVIRNLLENAVKYTPGGGLIEINLTTLPEGSAVPEEIQVAIADQGIGISLPEQDLLFEKFYRASNASDTALGLGLGLTISAEIIKLHQGRLWVKSEGPGMGSTFFFTLPLTLPSEIKP